MLNISKADQGITAARKYAKYLFLKYEQATPIIPVPTKARALMSRISTEMGILSNAGIKPSNEVASA